MDYGDKLDITARALGADHLSVDFTRPRTSHSATHRYYVIIHIPGNHPFSRVSPCAHARAAATCSSVTTSTERRRRAMAREPAAVLQAHVPLMPFSSQLPKLDFSMPDKKEAMDSPSGSCSRQGS